MNVNWARIRLTQNNLKTDDGIMKEIRRRPRKIHHSPNLSTLHEHGASVSGATLSGGSQALPSVSEHLERGGPLRWVRRLWKTHMLEQIWNLAMLIMHSVGVRKCTKSLFSLLASEIPKYGGQLRLFSFFLLVGFRESTAFLCFLCLVTKFKIFLVYQLLR